MSIISSRLEGAILINLSEYEREFGGAEKEKCSVLWTFLESCAITNLRIFASEWGICDYYSIRIFMTTAIPSGLYFYVFVLLSLSDKIIVAIKTPDSPNLVKMCFFFLLWETLLGVLSNILHLTWPCNGYNRVASPYSGFNTITTRKLHAWATVRKGRWGGPRLAFLCLKFGGVK